MNDQADMSLRRVTDQLYAGPLADFISSRDALAKELRSAGDREAASAVKGLRKPSRPAWALNRVAHQDAERLVALDDAVTGIVAAHSGDGNVRAAMVALREAVRELATLAAAESRSAGFSLDIGELSNAILAVLGNPTTYDELRSGRITEIPEAGGLDFLSSLPTRPKLEVSASTSPEPRVDPAEAAAVRELARQATEALDNARAAAEAATVALADSDAEVLAAQEKVRIAASDLEAAQQRREFARRTKESAAAELRSAEAAVQEAERRLRNV